jgi:glycosyltransferase involved in cell wall biosynthesis
MENQPLVSICCITYNHELYIREAIDSFLMQETNFDFEIVISDDCSTDRTAQIISEYVKKAPNRFNFQTSKHNIGSENNFKKTLSLCKGKYIAICDGDDYWTDRNKLQKQVDFLEQNKEFVLNCHRTLFYYQKNDSFEEKDEHLFNKTNNLIITIDNLFNPFIIPTNSIVFKKDVIEFKKLSTKKNVKDIFLFSMLLDKGNGICFQDNMSVYRVHESGIWSMQSEEKKLTENAYTALSLHQYFKRKHNSIILLSLYSLKNLINVTENNKIKKKWAVKLLLYHLNELKRIEKIELLKLIIYGKYKKILF